MIFDRTRCRTFEFATVDEVTQFPGPLHLDQWFLFCASDDFPASVYLFLLVCPAPLQLI